MAELSLTGLRVLRDVAEQGSFTAAARSLGYTQSAISRQVAGLEQAAGPAQPWPRRRSVEIDDLAEESWIAATPQASDTMIGAWQWADWRPRVELVARDWTAKLGLVAAGLGVTLVPGLAADAVRAD